MIAWLGTAWQYRGIILTVALILVGALTVHLWRDLVTTRESLTETRQRYQASVAAHSRAMAAVAAEAALSRVQTHAVDQQKQKVSHAQDGAVPEPVRAALDGVRALRGGHE